MFQGYMSSYRGIEEIFSDIINVVVFSPPKVSKCLVEYAAFTKHNVNVTLVYACICTAKQKKDFLRSTYNIHTAHIQTYHTNFTRYWALPESVF